MSFFVSSIIDALGRLYKVYGADQFRIKKMSFLYMICFSIGYLLIESVMFNEKIYFIQNQDAAVGPV